MLTQTDGILPGMGRARAWKWKLTAFGWWTAEKEGFHGNVFVYEAHGTWCAKVEVQQEGRAELAHLSEGHWTCVHAKRAAEDAAELAVRIRR